MVAVLGASTVLVVAGGFGPRGDRAPSRAGRLLAVLVPVAVASAVLGPVVAVSCVAGLGTARWWRARRAEARRRAAVRRGLPDAVDILAASLEAGRPVSAALGEAARWAPVELRGALATAHQRLGAGWRRVDVLDALVADLGPEVRPLTSALLAADRYGVPVADAVRRLVDDMRRRRGLDAETAARRLPVRLTLPLVVAVLPAFALLTVVPLLLSALQGLGASGP